MIVTLPDGRRLGVLECGDPSGEPLLYFHGTPGCRLEAHLLDGPAAHHHVRVIAVDRPGYGRSDFAPGRTIGGWADDVAHLADALRFERFRVAGASGGGPYALACAARLPDRVVAAATLAGVAPLDRDGALDGMSPFTRLTSGTLARWWPAVLAVDTVGAAIARRLPARALDALTRELPRPDRHALRRAEVRDVMLRVTREAVRDGGRGWAWDDHLFTRPWDFDLAAIRAPVHVWQGDADTIVPPHHATWIAGAVATATRHDIAGAGHLLLADHADEVLAAR